MTIKKQKTARPRPVIGWREWLALPDLGILRIKAKIDTGARTSSLHASHIKKFEREGQPWLRFDLHPLQRNTDSVVRAEAPLLEERWVRSSNGQRSLRPVIETRVTLGEHQWTTEITLVRRDLMGFRMLLGRQGVRRRFLIDPGRSYLLGASLKAPKNQGAAR